MPVYHLQMRRSTSPRIIGTVLVAAAGVSLWGLTPVWGAPRAVSFAVLLLFAALLSMANATVLDDQQPIPKAHDDSHKGEGLRAWYVLSCSVAAITGISLVTLVVSTLHWDWISARTGGVLVPLGVTLAAAIASAGAARTLMAQSAIAARYRFEDAERLLWARFDKASEQLANEHYAVRAAGVYSLAGLGDDWIRHNERLKLIKADGPQRHCVTDECETIIEILGAYLRSNRHLNKKLNKVEKCEEIIVNEAIITQIAAHFELNGAAADNPPPERKGLWARRGIQIDLRNADLRDVVWQHVDLHRAVLFGANLYNADLEGADLTSANLCGADLRRTCMHRAKLDGADLEEVTHDPDRTQWPSVPFALPLSARVDASELPPVDRDTPPNKLLTWLKRGVPQLLNGA